MKKLVTILGIVCIGLVIACCVLSVLLLNSNSKIASLKSQAGIRQTAFRNFSNLNELTAWLKQDKTETENYEDFMPYAIELQSHALADGYILNINYKLVDFEDGDRYILVTNSAIVGDMLYSILPCNLMTEVNPDLKADTCSLITPIITR
jgi:hypothetical protein